MLILETSREIFFNAITKVIGVIEKKHALPILSNILIESQGDIILFTTSNLEVEITVRLNFDIIRPFSFTTNAKKIYDAIKSLPADSSCVFFATEDNIIIKSGRTSYKLKTIPSIDFPKFQIPATTPKEIIFKSYQLKNILQRVEYASAISDIRFYLNGIHINIVLNCLTAVATDGHRMALQKFIKSYEEDINFILPKKSIVEIIKAIDDSDEDVYLNITSQHLELKISTCIIKSKLIDTKYPDYNKIIPSNNQHSVTLNKQSFQSSLDRASIFAHEKHKSVCFNLSKDILHIISTNSDNDCSEDFIDIVYDGPDQSLNYNISYLNDVLKMSTDNEITFHFAESATISTLITFPTDNDYKYVIMPMRI